MANKKKGGAKLPHLKPTAKKIKIIKIEQLEPEAHAPVEEQKHRVELEVVGIPIPLPPDPIAFPVEIEAPEFLASEIAHTPEEVPEQKKGIIEWLKSWWN